MRPLTEPPVADCECDPTGSGPHLIGCPLHVRGEFATSDLIEMDDHYDRLEGERDWARAERDHWIRAFNRLSAAITHHKHAHGSGVFADSQDDALWAAHDRVMQSLTARAPEGGTA